MAWFLFALLSAFSESLNNVFGKKSLSKVDEYAVSWSLRFFAALFLIPLLFFAKIPALGNQFFWALLIGGSLDSIATILYMKAIKHSDLSITVPILSFIPLFLVVTSSLIIGEFPSFLGLVGVLLIVAGSYVLNIRERRNGMFAPFQALLMEKGPKLMFGVALIWGTTANFDKIGVQNSSPLFWVAASNLFMAAFLLPIMLHKSRKKFDQIHANLKTLVPVGLLSAISLYFYMEAINRTIVSYVSSVRRTNLIMSVLLGHLVFGERNVRERLAGALIMLLGVVLIALQ